MKNIIFTTILPLWSMNNGSGGKALFNTISAYANEGYNVFIITNQKNDYAGIKNLDTRNIYYINTEWYEKLKHIKIFNKIITYILFKFFEAKSYKYICDILKKLRKLKEENTILYAYEVNAVMQSKKASKKFKIPLVTRFQGTIINGYKNNLYYRIRKYPHIQALSIKSDLVIMTNDGTQGDIALDNFKNDSKRLFIRNGVNILDKPIQKINIIAKKKELGIPEDKIVLITVSRLEGWKKVDRSILAFNELKNKDKYFLIIVGEGTERKKLEELTLNLKLSNNIKFLGTIPNVKVNEYMQLADIFLSFYDISNVGNPLLEALCLAKPIITYDVGDTNKIIDNKNGLLLNDVSPKNIAKNIENISYKTILEKYSKNASRYAHENLVSWDERMKIEIKEVEKLFYENKRGK